jgi:hypothetical protein
MITYEVNKTKRYYLKTGRLLRPIRMGNYLGIILTDKQGSQTRKCIHRIVLESFTDSKYWLETVNHKDGNKDNNCIDNLEWMTQKENNLHSRRYLRNGVFKKIIAIDPKTGKINCKYETIVEAINSLGLRIHDSNISRYCKLKNNRIYKGYIWRYEEDYINENLR